MGGQDSREGGERGRGGWEGRRWGGGEGVRLLNILGWPRGQNGNDLMFVDIRDVSKTRDSNSFLADVRYLGLIDAHRI